MYFDSFSAFLEMGGHGFYVWLSFGLTLLLILGNVWYVRLSRRKFFAQLHLRLQRAGKTTASSTTASITDREAR